jgi:uncharacterized protein (TIGR01777 family)
LQFTNLQSIQKHQMKKHVLIVGGTGLIGSAIAQDLERKGYDVRILSRHPAEGQYAWKPEQQEIQREAFENLFAVINLSGAAILPKRWTTGRKALLRSSRIHTTSTLQQLLQDHKVHPEHFIQISAVGYYGNTESLVNEEAEAGKGFLAELCLDWERAAQTPHLNQNLSILRVGLYLHPDGGIYKQYKSMARSFILTGIPGNPWVSYTHRDELNRWIGQILEGDLKRGIYNVVGPQPVRINTLARLIAKKHRGFCWPSPPAFALRMVLGEAADALLFNSEVYGKYWKNDDHIFSDVHQALDQI